MNEAAIVAKIRVEVKKRFPSAVFFKHQDLTTGGIPDISVSYAKQVTWIEVKLLKEKETASTFRQHIDALQLALNISLEREAECYYLIARLVKKALSAYLIHPTELRHVRAYSEAGSFDIQTLSRNSEKHGDFDTVLEELLERLKKR